MTRDFRVSYRLTMMARLSFPRLIHVAEGFVELVTRRYPRYLAAREYEAIGLGAVRKRSSDVEQIDERQSDEHFGL